ncbi:hypothetical protein ACN9M0_00515 [Streptomyces sp. R-07]|uniref:hypothetical protein n=1 Tax=Streptomyces sp. R-07 TaxID=3404052 RepID=UPI003CF5F742
MLDGVMVRRKREKRKRPSFGMPKGVILQATPEGWRCSVFTVNGGTLCGGLMTAVPAAADPARAQIAAAAWVVGLAHDFHGTDVEVTWEPLRELSSWTGQVTPASGCGQAAHECR